jgi:hypothetical protein
MTVNLEQIIEESAIEIKKAAENNEAALTDIIKIKGIQNCIRSIAVAQLLETPEMLMVSPRAIQAIMETAIILGFEIGKRYGQQTIINETLEKIK